MIRALILLGALSLTACAAPAASDRAPDPDLAFALGYDLSCDASEAVHCPPGGCAAGQTGETSTLHISLSVPDRGGAGRFCIATGCEDAQFEPMLTRAQGWTARMRTNDRTNYNADLEISRNLREFTLRNGGADGVDTWTGTCNAAGS